MLQIEMSVKIKQIGKQYRSWCDDSLWAISSLFAQVSGLICKAEKVDISADIGQHIYTSEKKHVSSDCCRNLFFRLSTLNCHYEHAYWYRI